MGLSLIHILLGVVGDMDVNTLEFEMPRRYKGLDLSEYEIQIRYKNIERGRLRYMEGEYDPPNICLLYTSLRQQEPGF